MLILLGLKGWLLRYRLNKFWPQKMVVWDGGYGRPMGLHGGYEVGMGKKPVLTVKNSKYCNYIENY